MLVVAVTFRRLVCLVLLTLFLSLKPAKAVFPNVLNGSNLFVQFCYPICVDISANSYFSCSKFKLLQN